MEHWFDLSLQWIREGQDAASAPVAPITYVFKVIDEKNLNNGGLEKIHCHNLNQ